MSHLIGLPVVGVFLLCYSTVAAEGSGVLFEERFFTLIADLVHLPFPGPIAAEGDVYGWKYGAIYLRDSMEIHRNNEPMKAFSLFFFLILCSGFALGDEFEDAEKVKSQILSLVHVLENRGVDTIFTYQRNAIGFDPVIDEPVGATEKVIDSLFCESKEPGYVFWISKGKGYCKKFHPCTEFETTGFGISSLLHFLDSTPSLLAGIPLKDFQAKQKGKIFTLFVDHSVRTKVWFRIGRSQKRTVIDSFSLQKENMDSSTLNLNYNSNRKKPFFLLSQLLESIIEKTSFRREGVAGT